MVSAPRMSAPPMVGVPAFSMIWRAGPSSRIGWPFFCFTRIHSIMMRPKTMNSSSDVSSAPPVRKLM